MATGHARAWSSMAVVALAASTATATAAPGRGGRHRLALVTDDPALLRAVGLALGVWDVDVVAVPAARTEAPAAEWSVAIAATWQVDVVVWMNSEGAVAWYDAGTRKVATRDLGLSPPLDPSQAAAVALTLKAELADELEAPVSAGAPSPPPSLPPVLPASPPRRRLPPPASAAPIATWEGIAGAGLRWMGDGRLEARGWAGARVFPNVVAGHAGIGVDVAAGPGVDLANPAFRGRWFDVTLSPTLRGRYRFGRRAVVESSLGASAHFTSISGTAAVDDSARSAQRVDGSLDAGVNAGVAVTSWLEIGAGAGAEVWFRHETFVVRGVPVLTLTRVPFEAGAFLRLRSE